MLYCKALFACIPFPVRFCVSCKSNLGLICQLYVPTSRERSIFVLSCGNKACSKDGMGSWRVFSLSGAPITTEKKREVANNGLTSLLISQNEVDKAFEAHEWKIDGADDWGDDAEEMASVFSALRVSESKQEIVEERTKEPFLVCLGKCLRSFELNWIAEPSEGSLDKEMLLYQRYTSENGNFEVNETSLCEDEIYEDSVLVACFCLANRKTTKFQTKI